MKTFNRFVKEDQEKGVVFTFGRFNPPTVGHAKLIDAITKSTGGGFVPLVYMSHSQDAKKNPLDFGTKQKFMNLFFGKRVGVMNSNARHVFEIVTDLYNQGYTKIRMVVGSDRVKEFNVLLNKYNSVKGRHGFYKFDDIQIISAGERDPDSDDVSGMSASKMRLSATENDFDSFKTGVPDQKHAEKLWKAVKRGMGLKEETLPSYMQEDLLDEGVYDQGIFKAVFLMGGPGSGKTTVVKALALHTLGLKMINSDNHFERMMKTANMSMKMTKDGSGENNPERDGMRAKAKEIVGKQMDMYIPNRLGLVFDTTSAKASKIQNYKSLLDKLGYESKMVFVKTSLDLALKLNNTRARTVPPEVLKMEHDAVEKNAVIFRGMFRSDFIEIENDDTVASLKKTADNKFGSIAAWTKKFPTNSTAVAWKSRELLLKKTK